MKVNIRILLYQSGLVTLGRRALPRISTCCFLAPFSLILLFFPPNWRLKVSAVTLLHGRGYAKEEILPVHVLCLKLQL